MKMNIFILWLIAALIFPTSGHAESMTISLNERIEKTTGDNTFEAEMNTVAPTGVLQESHTSTLTLFPEAFVVKKGDIEEIYNFNDATYYRINNDKKEVLRIPIHAFPAYAQQEKRSRTGAIQTMLVLVQSGKFNKDNLPMFSPVDLELELGSPSKSKLSDEIIVTKTETRNTFSYNGTEINTYTRGKNSIPPSLANSYERFILYKIPSQAVVRDAISKEPVIFSEITYAFRSLAPLRTVGIVEASSINIDTKDDRKFPELPAGYKMIYSAHPQLDKIVAKLKSENSKRTRISEYNERMKDLISKKKYIEASFVFFESSVAFTAEETKVLDNTIAELYSHIEEAPDLVPLTNAVRTNSKNEAELKIAEDILNQAIAQYPDATILNLFLANHIKGAYGEANSLSPSQNDKLAKTTSMILKTLEESPRLPNAWVDLGDAYYLQFDTFAAMQSWEVANELNPQASLVARTLDYKKYLEKNFPEYF